MAFADQLKQLTHNKKAMLGIGGAGAVGLFVLYKRKASTGSTSTSGTTASTTDGTSSTVPYTSASTYPNTYSTDLASALGNMDSNYASAVQGYQQQLTSVQSALASLNGSGGAVTTPDTTSYNPSYTPPAATSSGSSSSSSGSSFGGGGAAQASAGASQSGVTVPKTTPAQQATLPAGYGWFDTGQETYTLDSIARRFGISDATLVSLNPSLTGKTGSAIVGKSQTIQVRGNAAPFNLAAYKKVNPTEKL